MQRSENPDPTLVTHAARSIRIQKRKKKKKKDIQASCLAVPPLGGLHAHAGMLLHGYNIYMYIRINDGGK